MSRKRKQKKNGELDYGLILTEIMAETAYTLMGLYALPVYTVQEIHKNIGKIKAARDLRFIRCISAAVWGGDENSEYMDTLRDAAGSVFDEMAEDEMHMSADERKQVRAWQMLKGLTGGGQ